MKYVIECPNCHSYAEASTGFLGIGKTRQIACGCGYTINVATDKLITKECPHCGNGVIYDQSKGDGVRCPVCHEKVITPESLSRMIDFTCPSCTCTLSADKNASQYTCPLCNTVIDVQKQVQKEAIRSKGLASIIKFEAESDVIVWKHPIEDFNLGSQLIVHESQEAVFFKDGQALDLFGAGRYTLTTQNLPVLQELYKLPSNADTPFHSEVYFINLTPQLAMKWGTADKVTFIDPTSQAPVSIGARGLFNISVLNSRKLLMKLIGTSSGLRRSDLSGDGQGAVKQYFRSVVQTAVATTLGKAITDEKIDILQLDLEKLRLSEVMKNAVAPYFEEYGMKINEFLVEGIILPQHGELGYDVVQTLIKLRQANLKKSVIATETDIKLSEMEAEKTISIRTEQNAVEVENAHRQAVAARGETDIVETQYEGQKKIIGTQAEVEAERLRMQLEMERKAQTARIEAEEMRMKGYSQKDVIQGNVLTAFAENQPENGGSFTGVASQALQMGAGFAAMGAAGGMAAGMIGTGAKIGRDVTQSITSPLSGIFSQPSDNGWNCKCGKMSIQSRFCPECGAKRPEQTAADAWNCSCGAIGITTKFCPECGAKRPEQTASDTWNCPCGTSGITTKFCPECGHPKE